MCRSRLSDDRSKAIPFYSIFCTDSFTNGDRRLMKLAGVVTLYHPDDEVLGNMESYMSALDVLYVMDNTETPDPRWALWAEKQPHVKYVAFHDNKGISY